MTLMGSLAMGALTASAAAENRPVHVFLSVAIAPDGKHVASIEGDATPSGAVDIKSVVIRSADGTEAAPVTLPCGQVRECAPSSLAWAPDGKSLAFALRLPGGHDHDIYAVPPSGGAPSRIAAVDGTVGRLRYSPQGVLAALVTAGAEKEVGAVEAGAPVAGVLGSDVHEQRIAIIGKDGTLGWASPPDLFVYEFDWRPDGSGFVGTAAPGDGDNHWWIAKLYAFDAKTGGAKGGGRVIYTPANPRQQLADPRISRDGKSVSFIGGIMSDFGSTGGDAFVLPLDQQGASATNITPKLHATITALAWDCDGKALMASELAADQRRIVTLDPAGQAAARVLASSQEDLRGTDDPLSVACGTGQAAIAHMSFTKPPEIEMGAPGAWHDVTRANAGIVAPVAATSVTWKNEGLSVQGWLLTPIGVPADKKLAMITEVHGGPGAANEPFFVGAGYVKKLLDAGYALFLPNPRGSFGQGEAFTLGNVRDLGHGDLRDILAGVTAAEAVAPIDEHRLGLTGWSYGGFMTMWGVTQTNRFRAAVAGAGIANWQSYYGENGIDAWMIPFFGASVYDDPQIYARSSPINFIKNVRTPTLEVVGERDIECPAPQTQEFWHALTDLGVTTEGVIYPGEGHGMRDPKHIEDFENRVVAWFDKYLK